MKRVLRIANFKPQPESQKSQHSKQFNSHATRISGFDQCSSQLVGRCPYVRTSAGVIVVDIVHVHPDGRTLSFLVPFRAVLAAHLVSHPRRRPPSTPGVYWYRTL